MIIKISKEEIEDLIKREYKLKDVGYFMDRGSEGYCEAYVDYEFVEGEHEL